MLDCAGADKTGADEIEFYDGACPKLETRFINLKWNNFVSFDLNVFRVGTGATLTFNCNVAVIKDEADMPPACNSKTTRQTRQNGETGETGQVSVTLNIAPDEKSNLNRATLDPTDTATAAEVTSSANIFICIIFIIVL